MKINSKVLKYSLYALLGINIVAFAYLFVAFVLSCLSVLLLGSVELWVTVSVVLVDILYSVILLTVYLINVRKKK